MLYYVVFERKDCPKMFGFIFVWYFCTSAKLMYCHIVHNFKHMEFGNIFEGLGKQINVIFGIHNMVNLNFKAKYRNKYKAYLEFCS